MRYTLGYVEAGANGREVDVKLFGVDRDFRLGLVPRERLERLY